MHNDTPITDAWKKLSIALDKYEWVYDITHTDKQITVYVKIMNREVFSLVPHSIHGYKVDLAYSAYLNVADEYGPNNKHIIRLYDNER